MEADRVEIFRNVRDAAAQVIAGKGATNWAVGLAVVRILEAILRDEQSVLTVCISVPCLMGWQGVGPTLPLPYSEPELTALKHSAELLKATARQAGF